MHFCNGLWSIIYLLALYGESYNDNDDDNILEFLLRVIFYVILIIVDHQCVFVATACLWCSRLEMWEKEAKYGQYVRHVT
jgi:hypothetical protein